MKIIAYILIASISIFLSGCTTPPTAKELESGDYGSYPDTYKEIVKTYLDRSLKDPESARIEYPSAPRTAWNKFGGELKFGYAVCVNVNAKNSYGGYTGFKRHYFLIKNGTIILTYYERDQYDVGIVDAACQN